MTIGVGRREPPWPDWTQDTFTPEGKRLLEMGHGRLRASDDMPRHTRISTEDFAIAVALAFLIAGRTDLLKRIP